MCRDCLHTKGARNEGNKYSANENAIGDIPAVICTRNRRYRDLYLFTMVLDWAMVTHDELLGFLAYRHRIQCLTTSDPFSTVVHTVPGRRRRLSIKLN